MRVGIIQSCYIPWRGYFDFIDDVDLFVVYDDVQYTKRDWRNRNKIKTHNGLRWLTVPVLNSGREQLICETIIDHSRNWQHDHIVSLESNYKRAPYFKDYFDEYARIVSADHRTISDLNVDLMLWLMQRLSIATPIRMASDFSASGQKSERLIDILTQVKADVYLTGPSAMSYLDGRLFREAGIAVECKSYQYDPYPQMWGGFEGPVTVLDLLMNVGDDSRKLLKSTLPNAAVDWT